MREVGDSAQEKGIRDMIFVIEICSKERDGVVMIWKAALYDTCKFDWFVYIFYFKPHMTNAHALFFIRHSV